MEVDRIILATVFIFCAILLPSVTAIKRDGHHLHVGFYDKTCPQAEQIVADAINRASFWDPGLPAALIRVHFHDCFVNGCDASILLDSTPSGEPIEKESPFNLSLRGLEVIDEAKARLEEECPGVVSCADTLAFAARESVVRSGLSYYRVPAGRRDGRSSHAADIRANLPSPRTSLYNMTQMFIKKGLTQEEMVVLSGAHSIGVAHCTNFAYRLYNFNSTNEQDPSLDRNYAGVLKWICPSQETFLGKMFGNTVFVPFNFFPSTQLGITYYDRLLSGKGLLQSDQVLVNDPRTNKVVRRMASNPKEWTTKFVKAMVRVGRVDVLVGRQGEIRKSCRSVN